MPEIAVDALLERSGLADVKQILVGAQHSINTGFFRQAKADFRLHRVDTADPLLRCGATQPVCQFIQFPDARIRRELRKQVLPDHGGGNGVVRTAPRGRDAVPEVTRYRPQPSARQTRKQAFRNFVCADNAERKIISAAAFGMQISEKRRFEARIMDNGGTPIHLIDRGNLVCGFENLLPDVGWIERLCQSFHRYSGNALHGWRNFHPLGQAGKMRLDGQGAGAERVGSSRF